MARAREPFRGRSRAGVHPAARSARNRGLCRAPSAGSQCLDRVDADLRKLYEEDGAPEACKLIRYGCGDMETAAMRAEALQFLGEWL